MMITVENFGITTPRRPITKFCATRCGLTISKPLQGSLFEKFRSRIMGHGHVLPQESNPGGNRSVLEESKYHVANVRLETEPRTVSTRTITSSGIE